MADGDYERGRGHEIGRLRAKLRALEKARAASRVSGGGARLLVFNGWAAAERAWDLCRFGGAERRIYSYVEQLDGVPEREIGAMEGKAVLVGWSMGGSAALRIACRHRGKVAGLVLAAATPRMMSEAESGWAGMTPRRLEALRRGLELTQGEGFFGIPEGMPNPYLRDDPENLERGLKYLLETDVRAELEEAFGGGCEFPVRILQSERDGIVRAANAEYLKKIFPEAEVAMLPGGEHALPLFAHSEIDAAVESVFARFA